MKKTLFFVALAATALTFASCGNKTDNNENACDSTLVDTAAVAEEQVEGIEALTQALEAGDASQLQTVAETMQNKVQELIASGDATQAEAYKLQLEKWYNENKAKVEKVAAEGLNIGQIVETVKALPTNAEKAGESAVEAAKADAKNVGEQVKDAAKQKAQEEVNKAEQKVNEKVQQETQKAVDKANQKVQEGVQKGVNKLLGK